MGKPIKVGCYQRSRRKRPGLKRRWTRSTSGWGKRTIVDDGAGGGTVLLGPPFKFNAENIDEWKDVY